LLQVGIDVDDRSYPKDDAPMMKAAYYGKLEMVKFQKSWLPPIYA